jgi:hypothetical protein
LVAVENPDADLSWVEHDGAALESGEKDLEKLEQRMEVLGMQPMLERATGATATGDAIVEGRANTVIQNWISVLEGGLFKAYTVGADWINQTQDMPEEFKVDVYNDFGVALRHENEADLLLKARLADEIDHGTFINELRRRGILSEMADASKIEQELEDEQQQGLNNTDVNFIKNNLDDEEDDNSDGTSSQTEEDEEGEE